MAKRNSSGQDFTNNADGFTLGGGVTQRDLTVTTGNITLNGTGAFVYTFPGITSTLCSIPVVSTVTTTATITATNQQPQIIIADATGGSFTITLPSAASNSGLVLFVKRINSGANTVTLATVSAQTIDGDTTMIINSQYTTLAIVSNGTNWFII